MIKAVLFDFWGTLVENGTYSPLKQTYKSLQPRMPFGAFVHQFEQQFMTQKFTSQEEALTTALTAMRIPVKQFIIDRLIGLYNKNRLLCEPYPETFEVLKDLRKEYKLVLVSNTDCFIESVYEKFEFRDYFDLVMNSYETGLLKTDPKLYAKILDELDLDASEVIMVGDSMETDIEGARAAGIKAILVDRNDKRAFDPKVTSLLQLQDKIPTVK